MQKVSSFMREALFNPASGYYRTKNPIGKNADFITAPEISQVFGELLAAYIVQISCTIKKPIAFVEMGAGRGVLFHDIISAIKKLAAKNLPTASEFIAKTSFHIIEISEVLEKTQQEKLQNFAISWHKNFAEFIQEISTQNREIFFISNELFDCFAIDQYVKTDIGWCERLVGQKKFITADFDLSTHQFVENLIGHKKSQAAPFGAVFEYSVDAKNFMSELCKALKTLGGIAINFDYGYIETDFSNSLQAIKNHQKINVLENVGDADITALVDFLMLEKIAKNFALNSSLISQAEFLQALGIEERRKILLAKNPKKRQEINLAIDRLISSDQMGELFKCLIVWK